MNTWKVILATMVIFGTGVVTGGLLVRHSERWPRPSDRQVVPRPQPQPLLEGLMNRAQRELNLTPEQHGQIERIIRESREDGRKLMKQTMERIRAELAPEQTARFDQMLKQQQQQQQRPRRPEGFQPPNRPNNQGPPPPQHDRPPGDLPPPNRPPPTEF